MINLSEESTSYKALWMAVLTQAMVDYIEPRTLPYSRDRRRTIELIRDDALRWFASRDTEIGSFLWICEELDITEADVQQAIEKEYLMNHSGKVPHRRNWNRR